MERKRDRLRIATRGEGEEGKDGIVLLRDAEVVQRLQIGIGGIAAIVLIVSVASVITERALQNEENAVPEAAPTVEPTAIPTSDPLSDAGVVPDLPEQAGDEPVPEGPVLPETGEGGTVEPPAQQP